MAVAGTSIAVVALVRGAFTTGRHHIQLGCHAMGSQSHLPANLLKTQGLVMLELARVAISAEFYTFDVVNTFPHDHRAFTQGLHVAPL